MKHALSVTGRDAPWRRPLARILRACLLIGVAALTGCMQAHVVQYTSFHNRNFPQRDQAAELQQRSTADLLANGYLLIGYIDLRTNVRTCYEDGQCVAHSDSVLPSADELRKEAARRGGDVVTLLDERTTLEEHNKSYCTQQTSTVIMVKDKPQVITSCIAYETVPGKLEARSSRALIWRHDPAAAGGEANARAIEAALETLESAQRTDQEKVSSSDSTQDDNGGKGAGEGTDPLSTRVYAAIADNDSQILQSFGRDGTLASWSDPEGRSALMVALAAKQLDAARTLLGIDRGLERRDNNGRSAMHYAAANADLPTVRALADAGYDLRLNTKTGFTPLFYSLLNDKTEIFEWLLGKGLSPRERGAQGETTLMFAAEAGQPPALRRLLDLGVRVNDSDREGTTALMAAARGGRADSLRMLLKAKARPKDVDRKGNTALHYAAQGGNTEVIDILLKRGLGLNAENANGASPYFVALSNEQWEAARYLVKRGASLTNKKFTPADSATFLVSKNKPELLEPYFKAMPMLRVRMAQDPDWLQYAARHSGAETIRFLVDHGAQVDKPAADGLTPLMTAATFGNHETARALLELKANPAPLSPRGQSALKIATLRGHAKVVEVLRQFGVKE